MVKSREHWDKIFNQLNDSELGWHERDVSQTLKFLDKIPEQENTTVFLAGAGTSILVDKLQERGFRIILNDISRAALSRLEKRIGSEDEKLIWLHHDLSTPLPDDIPKADIWVDRAVLHFMLEEFQIANYFANLNSALHPGGYALFAEFSMSGSKKCAGVEVHRYSVQELNKRMGDDFKHITFEDYTFISPSGNDRPYIYALYRKVQ